jgi:hypothetical protein
LGSEVALVRDRYGYRVNGEYFRRVTTLLGGIPKPALADWAARTVAEYAVEHKHAWEGLPAAAAVKLLKGTTRSRRDDAAMRGTVIHATTEACLNGSPLPDGLTEEELDCAIAAEGFLRQHVREVLAVELTVFSARFKYAGTLDLWAMGRDGTQWIFDWKSGRAIYPEYAVQLAAYANAEYAIINKRPVAPNREAWKGAIDRLGTGQGAAPGCRSRSARRRDAAPGHLPASALACIPSCCVHEAVAT